MNQLELTEKECRTAIERMAAGSGDDLAYLLKRFASLEVVRRSIEDALKWVKTEAAGMNDALKKSMHSAEMQHARILGLTIFEGTDLIVNKNSGGDPVTVQVCEALKALGHTDLVKDGYNAASLKAVVREFLELDPVDEDHPAVVDAAAEGTPLSEFDRRLMNVPAELLGLLTVFEQKRIKSQKN